MKIRSSTPFKFTIIWQDIIEVSAKIVIPLFIWSAHPPRTGFASRTFPHRHCKRSPSFLKTLTKQWPECPSNTTSWLWSILGTPKANRSHFCAKNAKAKSDVRAVSRSSACAPWRVMTKSTSINATLWLKANCRALWCSNWTRESWTCSKTTISCRVRSHVEQTPSCWWRKKILTNMPGLCILRESAKATSRF